MDRLTPTLLQARLPQGLKSGRSKYTLILKGEHGSECQHIQSTGENGMMPKSLILRYSSFISGVPSGLRKTVPQ
jgi:hypothetical protein